MKKVLDQKSVPMITEVGRSEWPKSERRLLECLRSMEAVWRATSVSLKDYRRGLYHPDDVFVIEALATSVGVIVHPSYEGDPEV